MRLSEQWLQIQLDLLDADWGDARLAVTVDDPVEAGRAAALLAPLMPGRRGERLAFAVVRRGAEPSPGAVARALERLDEAGIEGKIRLLGSREAAAASPTSRRSLADSWNAELAGLPDDWSDLHAVIELTSTDHLDRAALLTAPLNPSRFDGTPAFRFRSARRFGYGAAPEMVRRCLERLDSDEIRGEIHVLRVLSDSKPVYTQGPVWYVDGRAV